MPITLLQRMVTVKMTSEEANIIARAIGLLRLDEMKLAGLTSKEIGVVMELRDKLANPPQQEVQENGGQ